MIRITTAGNGPALRSAAASGTADEIRALIAQGADVEAADDLTPLMVAAAAGRTENTLALVGAGAALDAVCFEHGMTALVHAVSGGHSGAVDALLEAGADPDIPTDTGRTALMEAVVHGNVNIVRTLLTAGADVGARTHALPAGLTALKLALENGHDGIATLLKAATGHDSDAGGGGDSHDHLQPACSSGSFLARCALIESETYDLGGVGRVDVTRAWRFARQNPDACVHVAMPLEASFARYMVHLCGVDPERAMRMPGAVLARPALAIPIDGVFEMIDGHHRAWARWRRGMPHIDTVVLPPELLADMLITMTTG